MPVDKFNNKFNENVSITLKKLPKGAWAWVEDSQHLIYKGYDGNCEIINGCDVNMYRLDKYNEHIKCIPVLVEITMRART